jgi:hypothetical protein
MSAAYLVPPSVSPQLSAAVESLKATIVANYNNLAVAMVSKAFKHTDITPKISEGSLIQLVEKILIPAMHSAEGGWTENPKDSGGATMRGVILSTFRGAFKEMFIDNNVPAVQTAAKAFNTTYGAWKTNDSIGKQVLYTLCSDKKVAALWIYYFLCNGTNDRGNRIPIVVMSEDPWLGFILLEGVWASGPVFYGSERADIDKVAKQNGWNGNNFVKYCCSLGDKSAEFATKVYKARVTFQWNNSKPGMPNSWARDGWMNRLIKDKDSNLMMLVIINELFNLNTKGYFQFTQQEQEHLLRKGEIYKTFSIEL